MKMLLLDTFIALISEIGAHQVTLQKVAKKANVPFSSAHYYYGGDWNLIFKDAAARAGARAQQYIIQYMQKNTSETSNPVELYAIGTFQWIQDQREDSSLWLFNYYFSSLDPEHSLQQSEFTKVGAERVLQLLYEAKGRGIYPNIHVTPVLASVIYSIIFSHGVMAMTQNANSEKVQALKLQALKQIQCVLSA